MDDYETTQDISAVMAQLTEAWECVPELDFGAFLELALEGYNPNALTHEEMEEMLNTFILQND